MVSGGSDAGRRVASATVARKDGTYLNKLTVHRVIDVDAGQYVCLCTNNAGYSFRRVQFTVFPRESATRTISLTAFIKNSDFFYQPIFIVQAFNYPHQLCCRGVCFWSVCFTVCLSVKTQTPLHGFVVDLLYSLLYNKSTTNLSSGVWV